MKKIVIAVLLAALAAFAFALPKPAQIEDALAVGRYSDARSMVQEVLREKPDSARAHLLNAYLLIHVDRNAKAAAAELNTAAGLDKKGDIKSSPLFGRVVAEIDAVPPAKAALPAAKPLPLAAQQPKADDSILVVLLSLGVGALLVAAIIWFFTRQPREPALSASGYRGPSTGNAWGSPVMPTSPAAPAAQPYQVHPQPAYAAPVAQAAPQREPMGAFGTAASVAGGVVAGNLITDVIRHSGDDSARRRREVDEEADRRRREEQRQRDESFWQQQQLQSSSIAATSDVSYESSRSSFSSSSSRSDDWGSSFSSSSSSDSSYSSSDSGSSSSSDW